MITYIKGTSVIFDGIYRRRLDPSRLERMSEINVKKIKPSGEIDVEGTNRFIVRYLIQEQLNPIVFARNENNYRIIDPDEGGTFSVSYSVYRPDTILLLAGDRLTARAAYHEIGKKDRTLLEEVKDGRIEGDQYHFDAQSFLEYFNISHALFEPRM